MDFEDPAIWEVHMVLIESLLDAPVDAVFTSDAYGAELARRLGATWVQVDPGRLEVPVSGTAVRADPAAHWHLLPPAVRSWFVRRVVVTGAESTGSTTLSGALAERLGCPWVPEWGREWTTLRPGGPEAPWHSEEFEQIARTQIEHEEAAARATPVPWLVCDTDAMATTLWHERYVGAVPAGVRAAAAGQVPPLARILTGDEIAFVQDGIRDGEHIRHAMQQRFRDALAQTGVPWIEVVGSVEARVETALGFLTEAAARRSAPAARR